MKLAVLSDIHGNWPGLQTVVDHIERWQPDVVVVAGDVINRGPNSAKCWDFVRQRQRDSGWQLVLGNHEEYVIAQGKPDAARAGMPFDLYRPAHWVYQQLRCDVSAIESLPFRLELAAPDCEVIRITHASMLGTRDGVYRFTTDDDLPAKLGEPMPSLFVVGHTHQPLVRSLGDTLVVNAGAVGMPFDDDPRLGYAQLTWLHGCWHGEIVRLDYDRAQAECDFIDTGFLEGGGPLTRIMLRELQVSSGRLYTFFKQYEQPIIRGEITLEWAVQTFLDLDE